MHAHSIDEINARLDDRFNLLLDGSRTALPRQQTLRATLDWSHGLLSEAERRVLRRVSSVSRRIQRSELRQPSRPTKRSVKPRSPICLRNSLRGRSSSPKRTVPIHVIGCSRPRAHMGERSSAPPARPRQCNAGMRSISETDSKVRSMTGSAFPKRRGAPAICRRSTTFVPHSSGRSESAATRRSRSGSRAPPDPLWTTLSLYGEGAQRIEAAAARIQPETSKADQARLSFWLASVFEESMPARALAAFEHSIGLYQELHDSLGLGHSRMRLARVLIKMGRFESAEEALADVPALESAGLPRLLGVYFANMGYLKMTTGDPASARTHMERALSFVRRLGSRPPSLGCTTLSPM